jgi:UDP-N-acetylglucosamine 1-carboxyvinyltransferase
MAEGTTMISGVEHIERGYDNVMCQFRSLGAQIIVHDADHDLQQFTEFTNQVAAR